MADLFTVRDDDGDPMLSLVYLEGSSCLDFILDVPEGNVPLERDEVRRLVEVLAAWLDEHPAGS